MRRIWPPEEAGDLDDAQLEGLYAYPDRRWVVVNFVSSADGAVALHGTARELSNEPDQRVLRLGSDLADVLLVGATTAMVEGFRGVHPDERTADRRRRHGLAPVPPTAVVTSGRSLPADPPVVTEAAVPSFVLTTASAPRASTEAWAAAGATVVVAGEERVALRRGLDALAAHGLRRVDCEGGPLLFGALLAEGLVDELRLTLSPVLVAGAAGRIAAGLPIDPARLSLRSVVAQDNTLMVRYGVGPVTP